MVTMLLAKFRRATVVEETRDYQEGLDHEGRAEMMDEGAAMASCLTGMASLKLDTFPSP